MSKSKSVAAFLVLMMIGSSLIELAYAQNSNLVVVTKENIRDYHVEILFDLSEQPTQATTISFEVHTKNRVVCSLTYEPGQVSLNGKPLGNLVKGNVLKFRGQVGNNLLTTKDNRLLVDPGSCRMGTDQFKTVRNLLVQ